MKIYTRIVFDWDGNILESDFFEYHGKVALCDRSVTTDAGNNVKTLNQTGSTAGATAGKISGQTIPLLNQYAQGNGPGLGPFGLGDKETAALSEGGAESGKAAEQMRINATRTGNRAGVNAGILGGIQEGARTTGSAIQRALDANAQARQHQMDIGLSGEEGLIGDYLHQQSTAEGEVSPAIDAELKAKQQGWLQNTEGVLGTLSNMGSKAAGAYGDLYKG